MKNNTISKRNVPKSSHIVLTFFLYKTNDSQTQTHFFFSTKDNITGLNKIAHTHYSAS